MDSIVLNDNIFSTFIDYCSLQNILSVLQINNIFYFKIVSMIKKIYTKMRLYYNKLPDIKTFNLTQIIHIFKLEINRRQILCIKNNSIEYKIANRGFEKFEIYVKLFNAGFSKINSFNIANKFNSNDFYFTINMEQIDNMCILKNKCFRDNIILRCIDLTKIQINIAIIVFNAVCDDMFSLHCATQFKNIEQAKKFVSLINDDLLSQEKAYYKSFL